MKIEIYCPRWGSENLDWESFCSRVKDAGYNGVEYAVASQTTTGELDEVWNVLSKYDLKIIAQHYDTYESDFHLHLQKFEQWLEKLSPYPVAKINSQTGKDHFDFKQNVAIIKLASRYSRKDRKLIHETHRGKFSFAAHVTRHYLKNLPNLRITLDASHWVCVAESYLEDQREAMELAISRTDHIHSRVGHPEGPQVTDPSSPEWKEALEKHLAWWDQVVELKRSKNENLTVTAEFGPFPYMVHLPYSNQPVSNQWDVNLGMMNLLRKRWNL